MNEQYNSLSYTVAMLQSSLSLTEQQLSNLLSIAVDGIIIIDEHGRVLSFNQACERMFGYKAQEVLGKNVSMIMPQSHARQHDDYIKRYKSTGERKIIGIGREVTGQHKDGTLIPVDLSVAESATETTRQFIATLRDLRARKAAEQRLNEMHSQVVHLARNSALDEMGAALAHELNQPLTAIMLYLQSCLRVQERITDEEIKEQCATLISKAKNETERATGIIQRMRNFAEKRSPEHVTVDLVRIVNEAIDLVCLGRLHAAETIKRQLPKESVYIEADAIQIQQIIVNLTRNALEAVSKIEHPSIEVMMQVVPGKVLLKFQDNGTGIAPEARETLFKAFSSTKKTGLGLGLAISRSIAQNHNGDLTLISAEEEEGACFCLTLPHKE